MDCVVDCLSIEDSRTDTREKEMHLDQWHDGVFAINTESGQGVVIRKERLETAPLHWKMT